ncbi:uncharacterized protein LOC122503105 [Leptopilina heterotoma]|uniref:uncharacterized protein LOC122503105 n=1 Tax=Leptopilina heterotoma TaxID=63436 RepID=UPI001CA98CC4|nr:uncharacterized protein LOC122503105 [Leptopilina heterotoma]
MKVEENRRPSIADASAVELLQLQEAAKIANIYHKGDSVFTRNTNLSHIVHGTFNFAQFVVALMDEIFHHVHHAIHHIRQKQDPTLADLPGERNPIFFIYSICMIISFIFSILWFFTKFFTRHSLVAIVGCGIGGVLMLLGGISAMRHAENHINLNEVTDEELLNHPIFIHNFVLCIISIFGMIIYFIQFWILIDYWRMLRKEEITELSYSASNKSYSSSELNSSESYVTDKSEEESEKQEMESIEISYPIAALENLPSRFEAASQSPEREAVILYCCFVDCYNYCKSRQKSKRENHEFQIIHVM